MRRRHLFALAAAPVVAALPAIQPAMVEMHEGDIAYPLFRVFSPNWNTDAVTVQWRGSEPVWITARDVREHDLRFDWSTNA